MHTTLIQKQYDALLPRAELQITGYEQDADGSYNMDLLTSFRLGQELGMLVYPALVHFNQELPKEGKMAVFRPIGGYQELVNAYALAEDDREEAFETRLTTWRYSNPFFCDLSTVHMKVYVRSRWVFES